MDRISEIFFTIKENNNAFRLVKLLRNCNRDGNYNRNYSDN